MIQSNFEDIVSQARQETDVSVKTVTEWDDQLINCIKQENNTSLRFAEALYYINDSEGFKELGFESLAKYALSLIHI